jgi:hypothetical protein
MKYRILMKCSHSHMNIRKEKPGCGWLLLENFRVVKKTTPMTRMKMKMQESWQQKHLIVTIEIYTEEWRGEKRCHGRPIGT